MDSSKFSKGPKVVKSTKKLEKETKTVQKRSKKGSQSLSLSILGISYFSFFISVHLKMMLRETKKENAGEEKGKMLIIFIFIWPPPSRPGITVSLYHLNRSDKEEEICRAKFCQVKYNVLIQFLCCNTFQSWYFMLILFLGHWRTAGRYSDPGLYLFIGVISGAECWITMGRDKLNKINIFIFTLLYLFI